MNELLHENEMLKEDIQHLINTNRRLQQTCEDLRFQLGVFDINKPNLKKVVFDE